MQKLLVPTDFSACATHATDVGLALASLYQAKLYLYTQINIPPDWDTFTEAARENHPEARQSIHNVELLFKEWENKAKKENVEIQTLWSGGSIINEIQNNIEKFNIDFLVMGSHGASGKNDFFIGSNTQKAVRTLHLPILIIKERLENFTFDKVVFASNFDLTEKEPFCYFLDFIRIFNPELHLVAINTSSFFSQPYVLTNEAMQDFAKLAAPLTTHVHFYKDFSVEEGVRRFADKIGAQLIAISNHQRHPLKRIFTGSNVEALVNHANLPVLTIDLPEDQQPGEAIDKKASAPWQ